MMPPQESLLGVLQVMKLGVMVRAQNVHEEKDGFFLSPEKGKSDISLHFVQKRR